VTQKKSKFLEITQSLFEGELLYKEKTIPFPFQHLNF